MYILNMFVSEFRKKFEKYTPFSLGIRLPELDFIKGDHLEFLTKTCRESFKERLNNGKIPLDKKQIYVERVKHELNVIDTLGFVDYFLIVYDLHKFLRENNIPRNPSRGSAGGSLVLNLLDVTRIDPIEHGLYFERMLSATRAQYQIIDGVRYLDPTSIMDQDTDVGQLEREQVLNYLNKKYFGKVAKTLTLGTLSGKILIKECGKIVAEKSEEEMQLVANLIPKHFGIVTDIEDAYSEDEKFKEWCDKNIKAYKIALQLRGLIKSRGVHPSGILISYHNIDTVMPLDRTKDGDLVSSFDQDSASQYCMKLDILGVRVASIAKWIGERVGVLMDDINTNHPSIYEYLNNDVSLQYLTGLFQIDQNLGSETVRQIKPKNLKQLSDCLALGRPGAMADIPKYIDYVKNGKLQSIHPEIDKILKETANIIVYQESLMKVMHEAFGFSLVDSDKLRKIVGKKLIDKIGEWEPKIFEAGRTKNLPESAVKSVWQTALASAKYQFNLSHSRSYAMVTAIMTFYKKNYPLYFYAALLNFAKYEPKPREAVAQITEELNGQGISLLPPNIQSKDFNFGIDEKRNAITFGVSSVKGISDSALDKLQNFCGVSYSTIPSVFAAAKNCGLNITVLSNLIRIGCFDHLEKDRGRMVLEAKTYHLFTAREEVWANKFSHSTKNVIELINKLKEFKDEKGKAILSEKRLNTIREKFKVLKQDYTDEISPLLNWRYEKGLLGYAFSNSLLDLFKKDHQITPIKDLQEGLVSFVAFCCEPQYKTSKNGNNYWTCTARDEGGSLKLLCFNDCFQAVKKVEPKDNDILLIQGEFNGEIIFGKQIVVKDRTTKIKIQFEENVVDKDVEDDTSEI